MHHNHFHGKIPSVYFLPCIVDPRRLNKLNLTLQTQHLNLSRTPHLIFTNRQALIQKELNTRKCSTSVSYHNQECSLDQ